MANFISGYWYTVKFANDEELTFKFLDYSSNPASAKMRIELCDETQTSIQLSGYKSIISFGEESPCKKGGNK
jgi:hypothetical protein